MGKYDFDSMGALWADQAQQITEKGEFVAHSGNWDLWSYSGTVYSIPVMGSGCGVSVWCPLSGLRRHLYHLRAVCGYTSLVPSYWQNVNTELLRGLGIV